MDEIEKKELLIKFITANSLSFYEGNSSLNSDCCVISGYALHLGVHDSEELMDAIDDSGITSDVYHEELERVFKFAQANDYGAYWLTADAKLQYKF